MIAITIDDREVLAALGRLRVRVGNMKPAMEEIGEHLTETTKRRFETSTAPDGSSWASNAQATILAHLGIHKGNFTKSGKISAKGAGRAMSKRPLIGESRSLMSTIHYNAGSQSVEIGSPMKYAAMQQFGGSKASFPHLWGDIPARPFLGFSDDDQRSIIELISRYLSTP